MHVLKQISTGRLIEAQSNPSALIANGVAAGYGENDLEIVQMTMAEIMAATHPVTYSDLRAKAYSERMPIGDQFDAVWKQFASMGLSGQAVLVIDAQRMVSEAEKIKAEIPKQ